jgi:hypothetical protein
VDNLVFPTPFVKEAVFTPKYVFCFLVKNQMAEVVWGLFLGLTLYSIGLLVFVCVSTMLILLLWFCNRVWSQVIVIAPASFSLLRIALTSRGLLWFHKNFRTVLFLWVLLEFWCGLHWICSSFLVIWSFWQY